ncbi:hypothetical protein [Streptomyces sp. NPDC050485]|uniref:hypothetical protein n=1 Tax=Streptomyces sp. NPDC050485 TaxID=3365617 RepID=UPI0037969D66
MKTLRRAATTAALTLGVIALAVPAPALAADHTASSGEGVTDVLFELLGSLVPVLAGVV